MYLAWLNTWSHDPHELSAVHWCSRCTSMLLNRCTGQRHGQAPDVVIANYMVESMHACGLLWQ